MSTRDIDTDQIIPARFLTTTSRDGLGSVVFNELRFNADGTEIPDFVLNRPESAGCEILVAGNNFGCGSSREHAPWALLDYGFRGIISTKIADIFSSNALKNGLVPVTVDADTHRHLLDTPGIEATIDIDAQLLTTADGIAVGFSIDEFARYCLLQGIDQLGYLRQHAAAIEAFEENRGWTP